MLSLCYLPSYLKANSHSPALRRFIHFLPRTPLKFTTMLAFKVKALNSWVCRRDNGAHHKPIVSNFLKTLCPRTTIGAGVELDDWDPELPGVSSSIVSSINAEGRVPTEWNTQYKANTDSELLVTGRGWSFTKGINGSHDLLMEGKGKASRLMDYLK